MILIAPHFSWWRSFVHMLDVLFFNMLYILLLPGLKSRSFDISIRQGRTPVDGEELAA